MNWKVRFRELTGWRPKNDEERTKNDEERWKTFAKSPTETSRKRYGSASAWIFFTEIIFLTNFKWFLDTRRVEHFCSALLPLFIGERWRWLPPISVWKDGGGYHPGELGCFHQKAPPSVGRPKWAWLLFVPPCLVNTPLPFFVDSFSVTLWNFTNYVTILVFFP